MLRSSLRSRLAAGMTCAALAVTSAAAGEADRAPSPRLKAQDAPDWKADGSSLPLRLDERLRREARRFGDLAAPRDLSPLAEAEREDDEESRLARSRRVERLLTRALRGALDDHLTELARTSPIFDGLFRVLDDRDGDPAPAPAPAPGTAPSPAPRGFDAQFRMKIDAHPRLQLRARMGSVTGAIEIPVLDPEVRVGLERPLGTRGRAALQGGWSETRGDWATLAISFSF